MSFPTCECSFYRCLLAVPLQCNLSPIGMRQTPGPTSFVVKASEGDDKKYKISIGDIQKCSCGPPGTGLCVHLYFVRTTYFTHTPPLSFYLRALGPSRTLLHPTRSARSTLSSLDAQVMLKVLRVPQENPLSWQWSLTDGEVENVLQMRFNARPKSRKTKKTPVADTGPVAERREVPTVPQHCSLVVV